jgi:hypothetical protein
MDRKLRRLWTVVLGDGTRATPIVGKEGAIDMACSLISDGIAVKLVSPVAVTHESEIIGEIELRQIAEERVKLVSKIRQDR